MSRLQSLKKTRPFLINFINLTNVLFNPALLSNFKTSFRLNYKLFYSKFNYLYTSFMAEGFLYIKGLFILCFIDALIADDEPLCEPVE